MVLYLDQSVDFYLLIVVRSNVSACFYAVDDCTTLHFCSISSFNLPEDTDEIPLSLWYAWLQTWQIKKSVETRTKKILQKQRQIRKKRKHINHMGGKCVNASVYSFSLYFLSRFWQEVVSWRNVRRKDWQEILLEGKLRREYRIAENIRLHRQKKLVQRIFNQTGSQQ